MAIVRSIAIGKSRKSAGDITFRTVRGRTIASQKRGPQVVTRAPLPSETMQQARFKTALMLSTVFGPIFDATSSNTKYGSPRNRMTSILRRTIQPAGAVYEYVQNDVSIKGKIPVRNLFEELATGAVSFGALSTFMAESLGVQQSGFGTAAPIVQSLLAGAEAGTFVATLAFTARVGDTVMLVASAVSSVGEIKYYIPTEPSATFKVLTQADITAGSVTFTFPLIDSHIRLYGISAYSTPSQKTNTPNWLVISPEGVDTGGDVEDPTA